MKISPVTTFAVDQEMTLSWGITGSQLLFRWMKFQFPIYNKRLRHLIMAPVVAFTIFMVMRVTIGSGVRPNHITTTSGVAPATTGSMVVIMQTSTSYKQDQETMSYFLMLLMAMEKTQGPTPI